MRVVNEAANLIIGEMGWGNDATREADAVNLLVNFCKLQCKVFVVEPLSTAVRFVLCPNGHRE
jgi:hypothetical protein